MRIGLLHRQQPFAEFVNNSWRVWYIFNKDITSGTYFELRPDGVCDRVTVNDGEIVKCIRVTGPVVSSDYDEELVMVAQEALEQAFIEGYQL